MTTEVLDEGPEDVETIAIALLKDLLPAGHVKNVRRSGDPLPFILVNFLDGNEDVECSCVDDLVSVHVLTHKSAGEVASRDQTDEMHRAMLSQARYLDAIPLSDGRIATIDYVKVAKRPKREEYGDEMILRRIGRYIIGHSYAKV